MVNCYLNERTKRSRFQRLYQQRSLFEEKQSISVVLGPHRMSSLQVFVLRYQCSFRFIAGDFLMWHPLPDFPLLKASFLLQL